MFLPFQSWDAFFRNTERGAAPGEAYTPPPSLASSVKVSAPQATGVTATQGISNTKQIDDHLAVQAIIRSYQVGSYIKSFSSMKKNVLLQKLLEV